MMRTTDLSSSGALSSALVAPPQWTITSNHCEQIREHLERGIVERVGHLATAWPIEITLPVLRRAITCPETLAASDEPFVWKPLFVRRSLGLAVVDACARGRFRSPAEAVGPIAEEAVGEWRRSGWRTFHWEPWLAGMARGSRAVVLADAVTWATALWVAFDWRAFDEVPQFGGAYDEWSRTARATVRLKVRSEMRVRLGLPAAGATVAGGPEALALVSVSSGCRHEGWADQLAFLGLVAGLHASRRPMPARVMGIWPDTGQCSVVEVDETALIGAVDRVLDTVDAVIRART